MFLLEVTASHCFAKMSLWLVLKQKIEILAMITDAGASTLTRFSNCCLLLLCRLIICYPGYGIVRVKLASGRFCETRVSSPCGEEVKYIHLINACR